MTTEFQILFRRNPQALYDPAGEIQSVLAIAEAPGQLRAQFNEAGYEVVSIAAVRSVIDWDQPNFDRDEAAEFLRIKSGTLSLHKGNGHVPWSKAGAGIYPRAWLQRYVLENANAAGKQIAGRLEDKTNGHALE